MSLRQELERLAKKNNFRLQNQGISMLLSQVREFVTDIAEENNKLKEKYNIEREARKNPTTPEEEDEVAEARASLEALKDIERNNSEKRRALRNLESEVQSLLSEIRKAH